MMRENRPLILERLPGQLAEANPVMLPMATFSISNVSSVRLFQVRLL